MNVSVKEYIDSFIMDVNNEINWKYLKSSRELKKEINDIVFQIGFTSSKYNSSDSHIEIRCGCGVWCKKYDKSLTINSGIAGISFLEDKEYWWDIRSDKNRKAVLHSLIQEINTKVIPFTAEMENDFNSGLLKLIYSYGFYSVSNSIQLIDELFGREEALIAANQYSKSFTKLEQNMVKRFIKGEIDLVNEKNLRYMIDNHLIDLQNSNLQNLKLNFIKNPKLSHKSKK